MFKLRKDTNCSSKKVGRQNSRLTPGATPLLAVALILMGIWFFCIRTDSGTARASINETVSGGQPTSAQHIISGCWEIVPSPNYQAGTADMRNLLGRVHAVSRDTAWATGAVIANSGSGIGGRGTDLGAKHALKLGSDALVELLGWNGTEWSIVYTRTITTYASGSDVDAISEIDAWAVLDDTVLHWNGISWNVSKTFENVGLKNVEVISTNDVWVIGGTGSEPSEPFTAHWDGTNWSTIEVPYPAGTTEAHLNGLDVIASNDVWAVGNYGFGIFKTLTYALHWDGTNWDIVSTPNPGFEFNWIGEVSAISSSDVWATGSSVIGAGERGFILHWDGTVWQEVQIPPIGIQDYLSGITTLAPNDIWVARNYKNDQGWPTGITMHWDGANWEFFPNPVSTSEQVSSVADISTDHAGKLWMVGHYDPEGQVPERSLILRYDPGCIPTVTPVVTPSPTVQPTETPIYCPGQLFTDVCEGDYFYVPVLVLHNLHVVTGYNTVPPCATPRHTPCFKPYNTSTRGQMSKIVALAAGFSEPVQSRTFEDVQQGSTFYTYIEQLAGRGFVSGYPCGGDNEPCIAPDNRPYFRPGSNITRGQLSKITAEAFNFNEPVTGQLFEDVLPGSNLYPYIQRLASRGIIEGYECGGTAEPCGPENKPYFRPNSSATRGQASKIIYKSLQQKRN